MNVMVFYLGAVGLYGAGAFCMRHTSPFSRAGGDHYLRRDRRRLVAITMLALATMALALGIFVQVIADNPERRNVGALALTALGNALVRAASLLAPLRAPSIIH